MEVKETGFEGLVEIVPGVYRDERGFFVETYREKVLREAGLPADFVQDNQSFSKRNVIRGLHLQLPPHEQIKMVRVAKGKVLDIVVDVRSNSQTFGQSYACFLDAELCNSLYIPAGFAHGFAVMNDAVFCYKCSGYYNKASESGIRYDDQELDIDWGIANPLVSPKDLELPSFRDFRQEHGLN